ncbi:GUN4 domain-containing protein [Anabaena sp. UHCC 0253]|uniref:GUN4 domain-containing protein n=1 Tax=Anabaena sp. UHCC 0253 TaxID=2590019 RepID=UPI0020C33752|nr:GUN4 domain-containing protein [Anabaena sp. UHCC 0253]
MDLGPRNRPQTVREFREILGLIIPPVVNTISVNYSSVSAQQRQQQNNLIHEPTNQDLQLKSSLEIDYIKLQAYLKAGNWKEADQETKRLILAVTNRKNEGWLRLEDIDNLPCENLRSIDQLWSKYSNGQFGFSVQMRIYKSLGGTEKYNIKIHNAFVKKVGWGMIDNLDKTAPQGYLPSYKLVYNLVNNYWIYSFYGFVWFGIFSIINCFFGQLWWLIVVSFWGIKCYLGESKDCLNEPIAIILWFGGFLIFLGLSYWWSINILLSHITAGIRAIFSRVKTCKL